MTNDLLIFTLQQLQNSQDEQTLLLRSLEARLVAIEQSRPHQGAGGGNHLGVSAGVSGLVALIGQLLTAAISAAKE